MNKRKILIVGESQKEKAYILGYSDEQIIIVNEQTPLHDIRHLIADNPQIKVIISPSFSALSTNFKEFESFVGFCLCNRINIFIDNPNMSLYEVDEEYRIKKDRQGFDLISIPFKTRLLIETNFEHF